MLGTCHSYCPHQAIISCPSIATRLNVKFTSAWMHALVDGICTEIKEIDTSEASIESPMRMSWKLKLVPRPPTKPFRDAYLPRKTVTF